jgi:hypothetical protein
VSFDCLLDDIASARKLMPQAATKVDNFVSSKRNEISAWILKSLNQALKLNKLRTVESVPWTCLKKGNIQGYQITWKGWPSGVNVQRRMPKNDCDMILGLMKANDIQVHLRQEKNDTQEE